MVAGEAEVSRETSASQGAIRLHPRKESTMFTTALIGLALLTPSPDDPTIIGPELVQLVIADPTSSEPLCIAYSAVVAAVDDMPIDYTTADVLMQAADAFLIITVEGDDMRLDAEARDVFVDWLHTDCTRLV